MTLLRQYRWLMLILAGYLILATIYSLVTPLFEASDELWHYPMVKYVADHRFGLPVQVPGQSDSAAPWRQEGSQPPLYYMLGAALTFWIDTSDLPQVRRVNPHADIGVVVPDGNANMVAHDHALESFPWSGAVLAMRIVRFLSILMGLGTVIATYLLGRKLFPNSREVALAAAAFTAFNPMFLFVSAAINNDNLSTLIATILLLLIVRLIRRWDDPPTPRFYALLGVVAGAGMLAKFQIGFLLPLVALALLIVSIRARDWRPVVVGGAISGGLTILIAGWWYWRNYDLYGDATGINIFLDIVGRRAVPADLRQLWTERETFMMSFWGMFGGVNVPMRDSIYMVFNLLVAISVLGLIYALIRGIARRARSRSWPGDPALLVAVIWPLIVFVTLFAWTRQTWASQGRLLFSALAALNLWLAVGIAAWTPPAGRIRAISLGAAAAIFIGAAVLTPWDAIRPAYTLEPEATWADSAEKSSGLIIACFREPDADQDALCLAAHPLGGTLRPGEYLRFAPTLAVNNAMARDWSIFVHIVNADGSIEAQRDVYPGGGLLATSDLTPGDTWNNRIAVLIPKGTYTPQTLDVYVGFYDLTSPNFERMSAVGQDADSAQNRLYLGQIRLEPPPGAVPNPVDVNFADELTLRGYEISDRSLKPGTDTTITLYWAARRQLHTEFVISVQIIDPDPSRLTKAAQEDRPPAPSTTEWEPGALVTETRTLTIAPDAAPGRYRLMIRVYPAGDAAHPLRVRAGTGGQSEDFVWLSWVQVE
jgi:4-amino-4-deoxy-L-arabinose transferase-like glycosyltransferase